MVSSRVRRFRCFVISLILASSAVISLPSFPVLFRPSYGRSYSGGRPAFVDLCYSRMLRILSVVRRPTAASACPPLHFCLLDLHNQVILLMLLSEPRERWKPPFRGCPGYAAAVASVAPSLPVLSCRILPTATGCAKPCPVGHSHPPQLCDRLGRRSLSPAHRVPIRAAFCIGSAGPALHFPVGGRLTDGLYKAPLSRGRSA